MKIVTIHHEAEWELMDASIYYEKQATGLGLSLLLCVETSISVIRENPEAFQLIGKNIRHKPLGRFPYSLIFAMEQDRIRILAIAHQRRRPGYWFHRAAK